MTGGQHDSMTFSLFFLENLSHKKLENVFMKHHATNYTLASKQNITQIKAKLKSIIIFSNPVASTI